MPLGYCFRCSHSAVCALFPLLISISSMIFASMSHLRTQAHQIFASCFSSFFPIYFDINEVSHSEVRVRILRCALRTCVDFVYRTNEAMECRQGAWDWRRVNENQRQNTHSLELEVVCIKWFCNDFNVVICVLPTCNTRINVFEKFIGKHMMTRQRMRYHWNEKKTSWWFW